MRNKVQTHKQSECGKNSDDPSFSMAEEQDLTVPTKTKVSNELKPTGVGSLHLKPIGQAPEDKSLIKPE